MNPPVRVLLIGSAGRMGRTVAELARAEPKIDLAPPCDYGDSISVAMKTCDVAIDFSAPDTVDEICRAAISERRPLVIGTTGHSLAQKQTITAAAESIPIVFASNFSVGVNALFWLTGKAAEILGKEFEARIVETHHRMKKDAPSGTAKTLAEILKRAKKMPDVPIQSIREGEVVGEHIVIFSGPGEQLELVHHAESRATFARGALAAAQWVIGKPPGLYSMQDVLGL
jgi:4-hydroxy-tetrahydrodipicolinate reductase